MQPAPGDLIAQRVVAVLLESLNRHPLQRRPAVGFIPLLAGFVLGRQNSARRQQTRLDRIRQTFCLLVRRHSNIQRHNAGGRKQRQLFDSAFQLEQEGVQIDGDKLRRADAGEPRRIAQPAGRVIPAGRRPRAQIAIHLIGRTTRVARGFHVLDPRFVARGITVVPVAVEQ